MIKDPLPSKFTSLEPMKRNIALVSDRRQFAAWFDGSAVVGADGQPLTLYHSTRSQFSRFAQSEEIGYHFGTLSQATVRARARGNIWMMSVYLAIKNPVELPDLGDWPLWRFTEDGLHSSYYERPDGSLGVAFREEDADYVAEALSHLTTEAEGYAWLRHYFESRGYDGIKYQNVGETPGEQAGDYSYIAFHPEQICIYDIRPCRVREPCPPCAEDHSFCP